MSSTPHKEKLIAAINNPKSNADVDLLKEALVAYENWISKNKALTSTGENRVIEMTALLNEYKDYLEVDLIATKGSDFLKIIWFKLLLNLKDIWKLEAVTACI